MLQVVEGLRSLLHQAASVDQRELHERPHVEAGTDTNTPASVSGRAADITLFAQRFEPPPRSLMAHLIGTSQGNPLRQPSGQKQRTGAAEGGLSTPSIPTHLIAHSPDLIGNSFFCAFSKFKLFLHTS